MVTTVITTPNPTAMTCVQFTSTPATSKPEFVVGRSRDRALSVQIHDIAPSRIRARPSVATALVRASRPARGGPNSTPYSSVTTPPKPMHER